MKEHVVTRIAAFELLRTNALLKNDCLELNGCFSDMLTASSSPSRWAVFEPDDM